MKQMRVFLLSVFVTLLSCGENFDRYVGLHVLPEGNAKEPSRLEAILQRHKDTPLKILAIGNSFTMNATDFMPWLLKIINDDDACIGMLARSGCSLSMHWASHSLNSPDYTFYYSDAGQWIKTESVRIDDALTVFDWDIIVMQQASGESGVYYTYQPALDFLIQLFYEANPDIKIAWHYTWAYTEWAKHKDFSRYDHNPLKMYEAILAAGDHASENMDIKIPSTQLIWRMREEYREATDGFSEDGIHITDINARYALSKLWYETLVKPYMGTSCMNLKNLPDSVDGKYLNRADDIIRGLTDIND